MSVVDVMLRAAEDVVVWGGGLAGQGGGSRAVDIKDVFMPSNAQAVSIGAEALAPSSFVAACDPAILWDVLVHGSGNRVGVFDAEGRVVYANVMANAEFGPCAGKNTIVGLSLEDYTPPEFAAEWKGFIRRVLQEQRPLVVEGMVQGSRYRARFNPVGDGLSGYVLVVNRNLTDLTATGPGPRNGVEVVQARANDLGVLSELTDREMEVLELIGEGLSTAEVARRLDRSVKTVEWHRAALGSKLGITNRVELARIAIGAGLCRTPVAKAGKRGAKPAGAKA
jgi:DNA-binding CsgD family transcriptional regulator